MQEQLCQVISYIDQFTNSEYSASLENSLYLPSFPLFFQEIKAIRSIEMEADSKIHTSKPIHARWSWHSLNMNFAPTA